MNTGRCAGLELLCGGGRQSRCESIHPGKRAGSRDGRREPPSSFRSASSLFFHIKLIVSCDCHMLISDLLNIYEPIMKNKFITLALSQVWKDSNIYADQELYPLACFLSPACFPLKQRIEHFRSSPFSLGNTLLFALRISLACLQGVYIQQQLRGTSRVHSRSHERAGG